MIQVKMEGDETVPLKNDGIDKSHSESSAESEQKKKHKRSKKSRKSKKSDNITMNVDEEKVAKKGDTITINLDDSLHKFTAKAEQKMAKGQEFLLDQYVKAREKTQKSPWILSVLAMLGALGVTWAGMFDTVWVLLTLSPVRAVINLYQVLFGFICFLVEASRYFDPLGIKHLIRSWCRILETTVGRGLLQTLPGSIAVAGWQSPSEWIPGLVLLVMGMVNIFYGIYTAYKLRSVISSLKQMERDTTNRSSSGDLSQVDLLQSKFNAMDMNGSGRLNKADLLQACAELKIELNPSDCDLVFAALDSNGKGFVDIKDFEAWWFKSKAAGLFV